MAQQIIKQPNGKYCLFNTTIDNITYYNLTKEDIVEVWTEEVRKDFEFEVNRIVGSLDKGEAPYRQFTMDYKSMLKKIRKTHSISEMEYTKQKIENND